jgi:DNA mismatch repair ATPase MutS
MKPYLLYEQNNENIGKKISNENELVQDLNLHIIFKAMAHDNDFLYRTVKSIVLNSLVDINTIIYRQKILEDCIKNSKLIHNFFNIASNAVIEAAFYKEYTQPNYARIIPVSVRVIKSVGLLELLVVKLEELRTLFRANEKGFQSEGMASFCKMLNNYLTNEFFIKVKEHIKDLKFISEGGKMIIGAKFGNGIKGTGYVLRELSNDSQKTIQKSKPWKSTESNHIPLDNTSTARNAREIEEAGLIHILRVINHFISNTILFFESLRFEIGFYTGCINLYEELSSIGVALSFPIPTDINEQKLTFQGLSDVSLALGEMKKLIANDIDANGKSLFIITGANQGGKSTFLRSIGLAQILMQCGMFVTATNFCANVCDHVFTHFTREEDISMNSGKLDEELLRMNNIINNISPNSLLLMNEPFATTTERDGSKIAKDIITALYELDIKVLFVTHLFEFANFVHDEKLDKAIFLRAERNDNGNRSYSIKTAEPLQTSYGEDLFNSVIEKIGAFTWNSV